MTRAFQLVFEMVFWVLQFCVDHPTQDPGYLVILKRMQETNDRAKAIAARQHQGRSGARGARDLRDALQHGLRTHLIPYLVRLGGAMARKDRADLAAKFRFPKWSSDQVFLVSVRALLAEAESLRDVLVNNGMSPTMLEDFARSVVELEAASESVRQARRDHVAATADLKLIVIELVDLVKVMDGINRWRFRTDPELLAEWNTVKGLPIRVRHNGTPPAEGPAASAA